MCTCYPPAQPFGRLSRCRQDIFVLVPILSGSAPRLFLPSRWPRPWPLQGLHARKSCRRVSGAVPGNIDGPSRWAPREKKKKPTTEPKVTLSRSSFFGLLFLCPRKWFCPSRTRGLHPASHEVVLRQRLASTRRRQGLATGDGTGCRFTWLRLGPNTLSSTGCGVTWRERRLQLLIRANLACLTNKCHFIVSYVHESKMQ